MEYFYKLEDINKYKNKELKKILLSIYLKKQIFIEKIIKNIKYVWVKNQDKKELGRLLKTIWTKKDNIISWLGNEVYYKNKSIWCTYCTKWKWCTIVLSYSCNRDCFFCYEETPLNPKNKINANKEEDYKKILSYLDSCLSDESNKTLAITWWEPLLFEKRLYQILEYANINFSKVHKRIYTNWDLMTEDKLKKLKELWVDEIRYSIKPWEEPNLSLYALTKKYIKQVMIEMPVIPNTKEYMIDILTKINDDWNIDWVNLNELTFNNINKEKYRENIFLLDTFIDSKDLFHRYFDVSKVEIWVYWSKILALELLNYFSNINSGFFIHYCDLDTVTYHHYLYKINYAKSLDIAFSEVTRFWLHKILRVYWDFKSFDFWDIKYNEQNNYIETSIDNTSLFWDEFEKVIIYKNYDYSYIVDCEII